MYVVFAFKSVFLLISRSVLQPIIYYIYALNQTLNQVTPSIHILWSTMYSHFSDDHSRVELEAGNTNYINGNLVEVC